MFSHMVKSFKSEYRDASVELVNDMSKFYEKLVAKDSGDLTHWINNIEEVATKF